MMSGGGVALASASRSSCIYAPVCGSPPCFRNISFTNLHVAKFSAKSLFRKSFPHEFRFIASYPNASRASVIVRSAEGEASFSKPIAPMLPESPTGQFLVSILESHPHLLTAAADKQLERLVLEKNSSSVPEESTTSGTELVLYRRIAEVKAQERRKAVEDIIYMLVAQKFVEAGIKMTPRLPEVAESERVDHWPTQAKELEAVHSPEALEMIREHLGMVLGGRAPLPDMDHRTLVQMSKFHIGQVYAASVAYGYFLHRVDQKYQLERSMKALTSASGEVITQKDISLSQLPDEDKEDAHKLKDLGNVDSSSKTQVFSTIGFSALGMKSSKLRAYVLSFDAETLRRCATMRSKESVNVIEQHTQALFGRPDVQVTMDGSVRITKDATIRLTISGMQNLVLEAVAFGSFLWDVESYVDSYYSLGSH